jgi:hypothetical protein
VCVNTRFLGLRVCCLWVLCVVRYGTLRRIDPSSRELLPSLCGCVCVCVCVCVIECDQMQLKISILTVSMKERPDQKGKKSRKKWLYPRVGREKFWLIIEYSKMASCF